MFQTYQAGLKPGFWAQIQVLSSPLWSMHRWSLLQVPRELKNEQAITKIRVMERDEHEQSFRSHPVGEIEICGAQSTLTVAFIMLPAE